MRAEIGRQELSGRQHRPRVSCVALVSAQGGADVTWFDMSNNNTTFLLPKQQVSNSSPVLNTANKLPIFLAWSPIKPGLGDQCVCIYILSLFPYLCNFELTGQPKSNLTEAEVSERLNPKRCGKNTYLIRFGRHCNEEKIWSVSSTLTTH